MILEPTSRSQIRLKTSWNIQPSLTDWTTTRLLAFPLRDSHCWTNHSISGTKPGRQHMCLQHGLLNIWSLLLKSEDLQLRLENLFKIFLLTGNVLGHLRALTEYQLWDFRQVFRLCQEFRQVQRSFTQILTLAKQTIYPLSHQDGLSLKY